MRVLFRWLIYSASVLFCLPVQAQEFTSGQSQVALIQLYTSEGCSSCPKADRWLSSLQDYPKLWREFVPVAFHVDYWDYLGWQDELAKSSYSQRQREHKRQGVIRSVYTPGFIVNDRQWRGWFRVDRIWPKTDAKVGQLTVTYTDGHLEAQFSTDNQKLQGAKLQLNAVIMAMDVNRSISRGENGGKRLHHDFVARVDKTVTGLGPWRLPIVRPKPLNAEEATRPYALAVWLTEPGKLIPLQATGGFLE